MKVLLIYPQYTNNSKCEWRAPSMSLVYLASSLEQSGHDVMIYDASLGPIVRMGKVFRYGVSDDEVHTFLKSHKFDIVGITCSFASKWKFASKIAQQAKASSPGATVFLGGLFPTYGWEYCMERCGVIDVIMLGEAELTFADVVNNISRGSDLDDACKNVDGVVWRSRDRVFCNPKHDYNDDLDALPFPAWHLADLKRYFSLQKNIYDISAPCLPILSSRSCPQRCRFCNMYITHGFKWRARSVKNVLDEFQYLINTFHVNNFYFIDDNFSVDPERAKGICRGIIDRNINIKYNFYNGLSIKSIDQELVRLMNRSGCTSVCLGVESGSERIRNEIYGKNLSTEKIFEVFNLFHKENIPTIGFFMIGAPGENRRDFEMTKELMRKLPMNLATMAVYTPYPGTALYDECKEKGWLLEYSLEDEERIELTSSTLKTPDFGPDDIEAWRMEFYYSFIRCHWRDLIREAMHPEGVVNFSMIGRLLGVTKISYFSEKVFR